MGWFKNKRVWDLINKSNMGRERERVVLREMGFGPFRLGMWEKSGEGENNKKWENNEYFIE